MHEFLVLLCRYVCKDWVATSTAVNIPLLKRDNPALRKFLKDKVVNGGSIPGSKQHQELFFGCLPEARGEDRKNHFAKKAVAVIFDGIPTGEGRCVLNIFIAPLENDESGRIVAYLIGTVFLDQPNHSTVSMWLW